MKKVSQPPRAPQREARGSGEATADSSSVQRKFKTSSYSLVRPLLHSYHKNLHNVLFFI